MPIVKQKPTKSGQNSGPGKKKQRSGALFRCAARLFAQKLFVNVISSANKIGTHFLFQVHSQKFAHKHTHVEILTRQSNVSLSTVRIQYAVCISTTLWRLWCVYIGRSWGDANISSKIFEQRKHHPRIQNATHDWVPFKDDLFVICCLILNVFM